MFEWISLFNDLTTNEKSNLEIFCQERILNAWELLFNEWDEATSMYIIKSWFLEAYNDSWILWTITDWEFVWEMALYSWNNKRRNASVKALKDTALIVILDFSIKELTNKYPEIREKIKNIVENRIIENNKKIQK